VIAEKNVPLHHSFEDAGDRPGDGRPRRAHGVPGSQVVRVEEMLDTVGEGVGLSTMPST